MDGCRFDAWSRRSAALALGGGVAALLGLRRPAGADARKKRKRRCRRVEQPCGGRKKCCNDLLCDVTGTGVDRACCRDSQQPCATAGEQCCRDLVCGQITGLTGTRCCLPEGSGPCTETADCCIGAVCSPQGKCTD